MGHISGFKKLALILFSAAVSSHSFGQSVSEDGGGASSILLPMGSLGFNSTDTRLKANYSNGFVSPEKYIIGAADTKTANSVALFTPFDSMLIAKKVNRLLLGFSAESANSDGAAALFSEGHFTQESKLRMSIGIKWYPSKRNLYKAGRNVYNYTDTIKQNIPKIAQYMGLINERITTINTLFKEPIADLLARVNKLLANQRKLVKDTTITLQRRENLADSIRVNSRDSVFLSYISRTQAGLFKKRENSTIWPKHLDTLAELQSRNPGIFFKIKDENGYYFFNPDTLSKELNSYLDTARKYSKHNNSLRKQRDFLTDSVLPSVLNPNKPKWLFSTFISGERSYRKFTWLDPTQLKLADQYVEKTFDGNQVMLNFNAFYKTCSIIGFAAGIQSVDNYEDLKSFKVESTVVKTDSNRTDKAVTDIKGKKGPYFTYQQFPVMVDYVYLLRLEKEVIAMNLYYRAYLLTKPHETLKNRFKYGLSLSFFGRKDAKFLFSVYGELNNPPEADDKRDWQKRITVGISAKLNLIPMSFDRISN